MGDGIKLIKKDIDLSNIGQPMGWDLEVGGKPYDIYRVGGYIPTKGGDFEIKCYWACPAGEKPTYENLIAFDGDAPSWGVTFDTHNYIENKHGEKEILASTRCWITRNGKKFLSVPTKNIEHALDKVHSDLVKLLEKLPLCVNHRGWEEKAKGKPIYYREKPAVIEYVTPDNRLMLQVEGEGSKCVEILSPLIGWYGK